MSYPKDSAGEHNSSSEHQEHIRWRLAACDVCSCKFNSIENLEDHMIQNKHIRQLDKLRKLGFDHEKLVSKRIADHKL